MSASFLCPGVYSTTTGYGLMRYFTATDTVVVLKQLSQEALMAELHAFGLAPPLLVHTSMQELRPVSRW